MHRVSIGLAVWNGENFLGETLDSLLNQTYEHFQLIISDNASTDGTEEICKSYAARDSRIRYCRNEKNIGAASNFNRVFELSTGDYFKWAHHDDLCAPHYLERCVEVLDREPEAVVCHPRTILIDEKGQKVKEFDDLLDFRSPKPHYRFRDYLFRPAGMWNAAWGLIRTRELRKTALHGGYISSDQVLLGELILRGRVHQIPQRLFFRRRHPQQSWRVNPIGKALAVWFNPANAGKRVLPPKWNLFIEHGRAIRRAPLGQYERMCCYLYLIKWGSKSLVWRPLRGVKKTGYLKMIGESKA